MDTVKTLRAEQKQLVEYAKAALLRAKKIGKALAALRGLSIKPTRRKLSATARRKMSLAAKARWAKRKVAKAA